MINKIIHFLIITLFLFLGVINSHLLDIFGIKNISSYFYINGNYEFFKVLFFNIFSGIIILLFFINNIYLKKSIYIPKIIYAIIILLVVSNIFSITPTVSLFGNNDKGHGTLIFINLLGLLIVLINLLKENNVLKYKILRTIILSSFIVSIIGTKEFLYPSFNYGELANRAVSTFGHPNYLALFLLLSVPILNNYINKKGEVFKKVIYSAILFFIIITLFLTKSIWAIFLLFLYIIYSKHKNIRKIAGKKVYIFLYIILTVIISILVLKYYPEKLSSFISRFYIWESSLNIIFASPKTFLIGNGLGNLDLIFEGFKNKELYIFENYGFIADRPHNIFLYIFYSFGVIGLSFFTYLILNFYKNNNNINKLEVQIITLFLIFNIFNFSTISSYTIIILMIAIILKDSKYVVNNNIIIKLFFITTSLLSIIFYYMYFIEENKKYNIKNYKTHNYLLNKIEFENTEKQIFNKNKDKKILCEKLIDYSNSAENYIYCGNILYNYKKELSIKYYKLGLDKLPDLWNNNSIYYNNIFVNKKNLKHRFFSEKYSNIKQILERVGIEK